MFFHVWFFKWAFLSGAGNYVLRFHRVDSVDTSTDVMQSFLLTTLISNCAGKADQRGLVCS